MKFRIVSILTCSLAIIGVSGAANIPPPAESLHGVVELGVKGIRALVVQDMGRDPKGRVHPPMKVKEYKGREKNPYDGEIATKVEAEVSAIKKRMADELQVPAAQIHVVQSSGLPEQAAAALLKNPPEGKTPELMTPELAARLVFQGLVPTHRMNENEVVVLDIAGDESRGAYISPTEPSGFQTFSIAFGTATLSKKINTILENGEDLRATAIKVVAEDLLPLLRGEVRNKPGMRTCSRLYLAGGLPYVLTTLLHPDRIGSKDPEDATGNKESDWVALSAEDINRFHQIATSNPGELLKPDLRAFTGERRELVEKEIARASGIFTRNELTAGAILLKLFMDEMNFDQKDAIFFSRQGLYAWPKGYIRQKLQAASSVTP